MIFSHTDLDGVGPIVIAKKYFDETVDYKMCNYDRIDETVQEFITSGSYMKYDRVIITDISVNKETAGLIDHVTKNNWLLFDHHPTALWLHDAYSWANVREYEEDGVTKTCGTKMFYDSLVRHNEIIGGASAFVYLVQQYDTWAWKETNNQQAKRLNDLYYLIGPSKFIARFSNEISTTLTYEEETILDIENEKIEKYIKKKADEVLAHNIGKYSAGVVFADRYISELGNKLAEAYPQFDFIAMVDMSSKKVSYRTVRDDINVSEIAQYYGGGGHPKASGSQFNHRLITRFLDNIFE
jgi:oligoribonuclease NrnB/cAMP/cGMP phosphodiesterase (DHH superfamily)